MKQQRAEIIAEIILVSSAFAKAALREKPESCETTGHNVSDHFRDVTKLTTHDKNRLRET
jgi:hypothetical protein